MKIELYTVPNDKEGELIKEFLTKHNIQFHEIQTNDLNLLRKVCQGYCPEKISTIRVRYSHGIHVQTGFNEHFLNQLLEHTKQYNPKIK